LKEHAAAAAYSKAYLLITEGARSCGSIPLCSQQPPGLGLQHDCLEFGILIDLFKKVPIRLRGIDSQREFMST